MHGQRDERDFRVVTVYLKDRGEHQDPFPPGASGRVMSPLHCKPHSGVSVFLSLG